MTSRQGTGLSFGDVVWANFPEHNPNAHEQQGTRPAVVVGLPSLLGRLRWEMVVVLPITSRSGAWSTSRAAYIPLTSEACGLPRTSLALVDQVRVLDRGRVLEYLGTLPDSEYEAIRTSLRRMFAL